MKVLSLEAGIKELRQRGLWNPQSGLTTGQNLKIKVSDGLLNGLNYSLKDGLILSKKNESCRELINLIDYGRW